MLKNLKNSRSSILYYKNETFANCRLNHKFEFDKIVKQVFICFALVVFALILPFNQLFLQKSVTQLDAGRDANNNFYTNAPAITVGNGNALISKSGINISVLQNLVDIVNSDSVCADSVTKDGATFYSARNFGNYGDQSSWTANQKGNAQLSCNFLTVLECQQTMMQIMHLICFGKSFTAQLAKRKMF